MATENRKHSAQGRRAVVIGSKTQPEIRNSMPRTKQTVARKHPLHRLREHPKVHWPPGAEPNPPWAGPSPEFPEPDMVVLTGVEFAQADAHARAHLTLSGTHNGNLYRTTLTVDDPALLANLCVTLGKCVGETIAEAGSHEVDPSLRLA